MKQLLFLLVFFSLASFQVIVVLFIRVIIISFLFNSLLKKYKYEIGLITTKAGVDLWFDRGYKTQATQKIKMNIILEWASKTDDSDNDKKRRDKKMITKYCKKTKNINNLMTFMAVDIIIFFISFYLLTFIE
jgi:hypothetical protein